MEGIFGVESPRHISFVRYKVWHYEDNLFLLMDDTDDDDTNGMILLLSCFVLSQAEVSLKPCFDLNEMSRRNKAKQKEIR